MPARSTIFVISILCTALLNGCAPSLRFKKEKRIESLGICLNYSINIPDMIKTPYDSVLNVFIRNFNEENHAFKLTECIDPQVSSIQINMTDTKLRGPEMQAAGCLVSTAGLTVVPFMMIAADMPAYIWFYWLPLNYSKTETQLSDDIDNTRNTPIKSGFNSWPYFGSVKSQVKKQNKKFYRYLGNLFKSLEKQYKKNMTEKGQ